VAVPLFIFMAQILDRSQVSEGLFDAMYVVLGGVRGGLGLAVILVSTVLAATTGIVGASVVAMGLMAGPTLLRRGYDRGMSSGIICASGTLGILIPPSIMLVVYGGLTGMKETSVGNLFAAAFLPGLLLSGLYCAYVLVRCGINPKLGPPIPLEERTATLAQKVGMTMKSFVPPFGLILVVMGTILAGVATPTEAAALGCAGALVLALFYRKLSWSVISHASLATARTTAMIMALFVGGKLFSTVFLFMGGGDVVSDFLLGMENRYIVLAIMMAVVFILGMFIDWAAILLVTVPIFTPIAADLGFNPLVFAMLMCINLQTSFLTPPFGYALFYFKGVAPPEYTMGDVYRGIIPFVIIQIIGLLCCISFPQIITYLPGVFFGG
jgi:tripartite ATP-independent transporter DctM subunit